MPRYIDADLILKMLPDDLPYKASVKRVLMQAPTADVVEVVRCKDCVYFMPLQGHDYKGKPMWHCSYLSMFVGECGFCNEGIREKKGRNRHDL